VISKKRNTQKDVLALCTGPGYLPQTEEMMKKDGRKDMAKKD
jgi:hypothetical protein